MIQGTVVELLNGITVKIVKGEPDTMCLRASVGGTREMGFYCSYRGDDIVEIKEMLQSVLEALDTVTIRNLKI